MKGKLKIMRDNIDEEYVKATAHESQLTCVSFC